ncbi:MAG: M12 family metallo-peptidase [Planctomycetota bacterium]|jgi:hypothetical protein
MWSRPRFWSRVVVAITAIMLSSAALGQPRLFEPAGPAPSGVSVDQTVIRARAAGIDFNLLSRIRPNDRVILNLFDDASFVAVFERSESGTWVGGIEGEPPGRFALVGNHGTVAGIVRVPGRGTYRVRSLGGGAHVICEIDEARFPPCGNGPEHGAPGGGGAAAGGGCDDGSVIDVLVVYTPLARQAAGGYEQIANEIDLALAATNDAYTNSLIAPRINPVYIAEIDYDEDGSFRDHLDRLTYPDDGTMDDVHVLRDQYGADMVALIVDDRGSCGIAWLMRDLSPDFEEWAFSVTRWDCAAGNLTFPHELGHNQGCCHAAGDGGGCSQGGLFPYSFGYRFFGNSGGQWRTVMAYSPGTRIGYFSNPDVSYDTHPTGVPIDQPDPAHNALTINQTALTVANFRCGVAAPGDLDGDGVVGIADLLILLAAWGPCPDCDNCPADLNGDCTVGIGDLLILLGNWG